MPQKTRSTLVPVEIVTLSDDQTRVVARKATRITPKKLAEYRKATAAWWNKESDGPPPPIVWCPSQAEVERLHREKATAREQDRLKLLETLTDPSKLVDYCEGWRKLILGPAMRTDEEWATAVADCTRDVKATIWPSMERIGGAVPPMPHTDGVSQENVREALNMAIAWCKQPTQQQPAIPLTDEDVAILSALADNRPHLLTQEQIEGAIPKNAVALRTIQKRLPRLCEAGLVERPEGKRSGYWITEKGLSAVGCKV